MLKSEIIHILFL